MAESVVIPSPNDPAVDDDSFAFAEDLLEANPADQMPPELKSVAITIENLPMEEGENGLDGTAEGSWPHEQIRQEICGETCNQIAEENITMETVIKMEDNVRGPFRILPNSRNQYRRIVNWVEKKQVRKECNFY